MVNRLCARHGCGRHGRLGDQGQELLHPQPPRILDPQVGIMDDLPALRGSVGTVKQVRRLHEGRSGAAFQPVETAPPDPLAGQLRRRDQARDGGADEGFADPDLGAKPDQRAGPQDAPRRTTTSP